MEHYDIIIVGAGIAGAGLAYNLSRRCPEKKVLVIDKKEIGANADYGYRNTTEEIVKEYDLPYEHVYKGMKVGVGDETYFTLQRKFYFLDYRNVCQIFIKRAEVEFRQEIAISLKNKFLKTDKNIYRFEILVDCSGHSFFVKKLRKRKIPFRYWVGRTKVLKNKIRNCDFYYHQFNDSGYLEDFYPLKNKILQGDWQYTKKIDFNQIKPIEKTLYKKYIASPEIIKEYKSVIPCAPVLPLVYNNVAFLGDSFGNATTSSAEGVRTILDTSKILIYAIKKGSLKLYEKIWKKKYLETYIKYLVTKFDTYHNSKFLQRIKKTPARRDLLLLLKKYPEIFEKSLMCDSTLKFPKEIKKIFPRRSKIIKLSYYLYLKLKYSLM